jgi:hypothetical protein
MHNIETLNKFLKDELSATETYQQAMNKFRDDAGLGESESLLPIHEAHQKAVSSIQALIQRLGGTPIENSGTWGTWAKIVQGGANMMGTKAALKALQSGEKSGAEDYEKTLEETELPSDIRSLIETMLLPAQQAHIVTLEELMEVESV